MMMMICGCILQGTRYLVSNGAAAGYAPYYAATPYATAAAPAGASAAAAATPVYPALAPPPTAIQYSMPTTIDNGCGQQMVFVGNNGASTGQPSDRQTDVRSSSDSA